MTEQEILDRLNQNALLGERAKLHPAWPHFVRAMRDRQYGLSALQSAWSFFCDGWEAADSAVSP